MSRINYNPVTSPNIDASNLIGNGANLLANSIGALGDTFANRRKFQEAELDKQRKLDQEAADAYVMRNVYAQANKLGHDNMAKSLANDPNALLASAAVYSKADALRTGSANRDNTYATAANTGARTAGQNIANNKNQYDLNRLKELHNNLDDEYLKTFGIDYQQFGARSDALGNLGTFNKNEQNLIHQQDIESVKKALALKDPSMLREAINNMNPDSAARVMSHFNLNEEAARNLTDVNDYMNYAFGEDNSGDLNESMAEALKKFGILNGSEDVPVEKQQQQAEDFAPLSMAQTLLQNTMTAKESPTQGGLLSSTIPTGEALSAPSEEASFAENSQRVNAIAAANRDKYDIQSMVANRVANDTPEESQNTQTLLKDSMQRAEQAEQNQQVEQTQTAKAQENQATQEEGLINAEAGNVQQDTYQETPKTSKPYSDIFEGFVSGKEKTNNTVVNDIKDIIKADREGEPLSTEQRLALKKNISKLTKEEREYHGIDDDMLKDLSYGSTGNYRTAKLYNAELEERSVGVTKDSKGQQSLKTSPKMVYGGEPETMKAIEKGLRSINLDPKIIKDAVDAGVIPEEAELSKENLTKVANFALEEENSKSALQKWGTNRRPLKHLEDTYPTLRNTYSEETAPVFADILGQKLYNAFSGEDSEILGVPDDKGRLASLAAEQEATKVANTDKALEERTPNADGTVEATPKEKEAIRNKVEDTIVRSKEGQQKAISGLVFGDSKQEQRAATALLYGEVNTAVSNMDSVKQDYATKRDSLLLFKASENTKAPQIVQAYHDELGDSFYKAPEDIKKKITKSVNRGYDTAQSLGVPEKYIQDVLLSSTDNDGLIDTVKVETQSKKFLKNHGANKDAIDKLGKQIDTLDKYQNDLKSVYQTIQTLVDRGAPMEGKGMNYEIRNRKYEDSWNQSLVDLTTLFDKSNAILEHIYNRDFGN